VDVVTLIGPEATGKALNDALRSGEYDVVHYAGHAVFATDDPEMSGLLLHGEELFHAEKIQRLVEGQPLVFLNACETGRTANEVDAGQTTYIGEPATGLAAAFLYGGALGCIGSLWPVYDEAASRFAIDFYHKLVDGALVGEAVRLAREAVHRDFPDQVTWAAYSLNGDPTFRLTRPSTPGATTPLDPVSPT
jgi:CHAT domain-containing protein